MGLIYKRFPALGTKVAASRGALRELDPLGQIRSSACQPPTHWPIDKGSLSLMAGFTVTLPLSGTMSLSQPGTGSPCSELGLHQSWPCPLGLVHSTTVGKLPRRMSKNLACVPTLGRQPRTPCLFRLSGRCPPSQVATETLSTFCL